MWKLCFFFGSHKWLRLKPSPVIRLIPLWLQKLKSLLGECLIIVRIPLSKTPKLFEFQIAGSNLLLSVIAEGKEESLKKLRLMLRQEMLSTFVVPYVWVFQVLVQKHIEDFFQCKFCKAFLVFCISAAPEVVLNLVLATDFF